MNLTNLTNLNDMNKYGKSKDMKGIQIEKEIERERTSK